MNLTSGILTESEKRLKSNVIPKAISRKAWSEVTTELSRQLYSMRKAMNSVGGDAAAAKTFYQDIEALNLACLRKKQDVAQAAYEKASQASNSAARPHTPSPHTTHRTPHTPFTSHRTRGHHRLNHHLNQLM